MDGQKLEEAVRRFRLGINRCINQSQFLGVPDPEKFPFGYCDWASNGLCRFIEANLSEQVYYIRGCRKTTDRHTWLKVADIDVDITAGQFYDAPSPVICTENSKWHKEIWEIDGQPMPSTEFHNYMATQAYSAICREAAQCDPGLESLESRREYWMQYSMKICNQIKGALNFAAWGSNGIDGVREEVFGIFCDAWEESRDHQCVKDDDIQRCFRQMKWVAPTDPPVQGEAQGHYRLLWDLCEEWRCWHYAMVHFRAS